MNTPAKYVAIVIASLSMVMFTDLAKLNADTVEESSRLGQVANAMNPFNWKMPKFKMPNFKSVLPNKAEQTEVKKKKDGLFDEVGKTVSNSWTKTKNALNPKNMNPTKFFTASSKKPAKNELKKDKQPVFWSSLLNPWPEEKPQKNTVSDFLRQPRISP